MVRLPDSSSEDSMTNGWFSYIWHAGFSDAALWNNSYMTKYNNASLCEHHLHVKEELAAYLNSTWAKNVAWNNKEPMACEAQLAARYISIFCDDL